MTADFSDWVVVAPVYPQSHVAQHFPAGEEAQPVTDHQPCHGALWVTPRTRR